MTAVAGFTKNGIVYMAADSLASSESHTSVVVGSKLIKRDEFLFGYTTNFRFGDILRYIFVPPTRESQCPVTEYMVKYFIPALRTCLEEQKYTDNTPKSESGNFLVGYQGHLFEVQSDYSVIESADGYASVGSGFQYCLGAMNALTSCMLDPTDIVITAIKAAIAHNPYVGGSIDTQTL